jgi:hypothetical protein
MADPVQQRYSVYKTQPTPENRAELFKALSPVISRSIMTYGGGDKSLEMRAWILADQALSTYNPDKGASLATHIHGNLQRLNRVRAERARAVHVPENVRNDSARVHAYALEFQDKNGYEPSALQVADALSFSKKRAAKALFGGEIPESQMMTEKGDVSSKGYSRTEDEIWTDYIYHDADDKDRKIMEWTMGYQQAPVLSKTEIAKRLRMSPSAVSQRLTSINKRLAELALPVQKEKHDDRTDTGLAASDWRPPAVPNLAG